MTVKQGTLRRGDTSGNHVIINVRVLNQLRQTNTVVLAYACDRPVTVESLSAFWLRCLCQNLELIVPVIVIGCKFGMRDENQLMKIAVTHTHTHVCVCARACVCVQSLILFSSRIVKHLCRSSTAT